MQNALERRGITDEIAASCAPDGPQRQYLANRKAELGAHLVKADPADVLAEVTALFAVMAHKAGADIEIAARMRVYVNDLSGLPLWAISEACEAYRTAKFGDGVFCPTPGEICARARVSIAAASREYGAIDRILAARVVPDEDPEVARRRKAVIDRWRNEIKPEIDATVARDRAAIRARGFKGAAPVEPAKPETPEEALERLRGLPLPKLSPVAIAKMERA